MLWGINRLMQRIGNDFSSGLTESLNMRSIKFPECVSSRLLGLNAVDKGPGMPGRVV